MSTLSVDELWMSYKQNGDQLAKDELIIHYISLVKIIAGRLYVDYNHNVEYDDIVSYGIIGLIDAIEKYDPDKKNKFETYANFRIKGAVIDQLRSLDWIPRSLRQKYREYENAINAVITEKGGEYTEHDIAVKLGITDDELSKLSSELTNFSIVSLEEKFDNKSEFDIKTEYREYQPEKVMMDNELKKALAEGIDTLKDRERTIISLYYYEKLTYREISELVGISESRISQIHTKAITKLKVYLGY